jgi:hypothetical protein
VNKDMHLNFLSAPIMPISMFFADICPSNLDNAHKRKQKGIVSKIKTKNDCIGSKVQYGQGKDTKLITSKLSVQGIMNSYHTMSF